MTLPQKFLIPKAFGTLIFGSIHFKINVKNDKKFNKQCIKYKVNIMQKKITCSIIMLFTVPFLYAQNIGIGTPTPDYTLDVNGQLSINDYIYHNDDLGEDTYMGFSNENIWELVAGGNEVVKADGVANEFIINQNMAGTKLRVVSDGIDHLILTDPATNRVGIGTATPDYLLDIDGSFRVVSDGIDHLIYADSDNNRVGIGQATPMYLLDIKGDLRVVSDGIDHLFYVDTDSDRVGIGTGTPAQTLDVRGVTRTRGLEFVSPYTGAITTFDQISTGTEVHTGGNVTGEVLSMNITFPTFYATTPKVLVTVKGTDTGLESDAIFVASVRSANSSGVTINLYRADSGSVGDHSWTQNLVITWMAWE